MGPARQALHPRCLSGQDAAPGRGAVTGTHQARDVPGDGVAERLDPRTRLGDAVNVPEFSNEPIVELLYEAERRLAARGH